jgi:hypothetical protein
MISLRGKKSSLALTYQPMSEQVSTSTDRLLILGYHYVLSPPHLGVDGACHPLSPYGDGSSINLDHLDKTAKTVQETWFLVKWENGDVLILDVSCAGSGVG